MKNISKNSKNAMLVCGAAFGSLLLTGGEAHAARLVWKGAISTNLLDGRNWSPAQVPTEVDDLVVTTASTLVLNSDITVDDLDLAPGSTLTGAGNITLVSAFAMKGATLSGKGTVTLGPRVNGNISTPSSLFTSNTIGRIIYNSGQLNWLDGKITFNSNFYNQPGSRLHILTDNVLTTTVQPKPKFFNAGEFIKLGNAAQTNMNIPMENTGIIQVKSGRLNLAPGFVQNGGQTLLDGGQINGSGADPLRYNAGTLEGTGLVVGNVINDGGNVAPGHSPGKVTIQGNYTQTSRSTLTVEVGGTTEGTGYDQLVVTGNATLAGNINIVRWNNYLPPVNSNFKFITYYSVTGGFANISGTTPSSDRYYKLTKAPSYFLGTVTAGTNPNGQASIATRSSTVSVSPVQISSATASAANNSVKLGFTGALDAASAQDTSNYTVQVNGQPVLVEGIVYNSSSRTVTLLLPEVPFGAIVTVSWKGLLDTRQLAVPSRVLLLSAL